MQSVTVEKPASFKASTNFEVQISDLGKISKEKPVSFTLEAGNTYLFAGPNEAGKSTIKTALACVLNINKAPTDINIKDSFQWIRDDQPSGYIGIKNQNGKKRVMIWRKTGKCDIDSSLDYKQSAISVQDTRLGMLDTAKRRSLLFELISFEPKPEDLLAALTNKLDLPADNDLIKKIVEEVKVLGYAPAHKSHNQEGIYNQRSYREITGREYQKNNPWWPANCDWDGSTPEEFAKVTQEFLQERLNKAITAWENALSANTVKNFQLEQVKALALDAEDAERDLKHDDARLLALKTELKTKQDDRAALKSEYYPEILTCCECSTKLFLLNGKLRPASSEAAKPEERENKLTGIDGEIKKLEEDIREIEGTRAQAANRLQDAQQAKRQLASFEEHSKKMDSSTTPEVAQATRDIRQNELNAFLVIQKVRKIEKQIEQSQIIQEVLGEKGVQLDALIAGLAKVNNLMAEITSSVKWPAITINENLDLCYGSRIYKRCAGSARYKMDAVAQIALAKLSEEEIVLFDETEDMDKKSFNDFFNLLIRTGLTAVVMHKATATEVVPDMSKLKVGDRSLGRTYRVEAGAIEAV